MGALVLPNFVDRGSTRREQGWQVVASSMAAAVARQASVRLDRVPGAADRRRGSHPRGRAGLVARHGRWGVALGPGILPMCRCSAFGRKTEERGEWLEEGDDKRVPPVGVTGKNDYVGAGDVGMRGRVG